MKKIIIGLVGETGSGKDSVADYLEKEYGAKLMRFADPIKDTLSIYFDKLSKEDQSWLYLVFKARFGDDILSRAMAKRVNDSNGGLLVINGIRMPSDYEFVKQYPGAQVLYITVDQKIRWERVANRGEKSDDKISFEKFQELDRQETEKYIPEIGAKADKIIRNEKDLSHLLSEVDDYMNELGVSRKFKEVAEEHEVVGEIPDFDAEMEKAKNGEE
jgi:dephospho-CoA kinase